MLHILNDVEMQCRKGICGEPVGFIIKNFGMACRKTRLGNIPSSIEVVVLHEILFVLYWRAYLF